MPNRKHTKLLHEGKYVAEVEIEIIDNENAWSPYYQFGRYTET